jgi:hypothetical protein
MYFDKFPKFLYDFKYGNQVKTSIVKDITSNVRFRKELLSNITLYDYYDIIDGETPEIIAEKIYGNPQYHWILMLANDRYDYITDFPLEEVALVKHIQSVYGANVSAVHHYENAQGYVVNSDAPGATSVSNEQYERRINESKRRIKIISAKLINTILNEYKDIL